MHIKYIIPTDVEFENFILTFLNNELSKGEDLSYDWWGSIEYNSILYDINVFSAIEFGYKETNDPNVVFVTVCLAEYYEDIRFSSLAILEEN